MAPSLLLRQLTLLLRLPMQWLRLLLRLPMLWLRLPTLLLPPSRLSSNKLLLKMRTGRAGNGPSGCVLGKAALRGS